MEHLFLPPVIYLGMSPILAKRFLVEDFTDSFDFIGNKLSKSLIQDIYSEYATMWANDPEDPNLPFDCESLLTILGDHEKAIACLDKIQCRYGAGMRMLRKAYHYACLHNEREVTHTFDALFFNPAYKDEKECAFIAAGRLGDRETAARLWKKITKENGHTNLKITDEVLHKPDSFNSICQVHIREWDEGVRYLYQYDIRENRDIELYTLISMIHYKTGFIYNSLIDVIQNEGPYEAFTGMIIALAISGGAYSLVAEYRDLVTIDDPRVYKELILHLEGLRKFKSFFEIGVRLLTISEANFHPDADFLRKLVEDTGGDIYQLYHLLDLFVSSAGDADYVQLLDILLEMDPDIEQKSVIRNEMEEHLGPRPPFDYI
jgi:tetratricopeptide (TPR) repeat protein